VATIFHIIVETVGAVAVGSSAVLDGILVTLISFSKGLEFL
jgi:hypothetical protein